MNRVARISYINTDPFFYEWDCGTFPLKSGVPRELARAAREGEVIAGPLPIVAGWGLLPHFSALDFWGIAARRECHSVLLLSNRPLRDLDEITVGVTRETSTSVVLLDVLIRQRYRHQVRLKRGFEQGDAARLVIGDQALKIWATGRKGDWACVTDLALEWWEWQLLPFVFAQWLVKNPLPAGVFGELLRQIEIHLRKGLRSFRNIAIHRGPSSDIPVGKVMEYLEGMIYQLGDDERESIAIFHQLAKAPKKSVVLSP